MNTTLSSKLRLPLFSPSQVYDIEKTWFAAGHSSFGLMQQAAWHMAMWIHGQYAQQIRGVVWVGSGNNGGDGWLIAHYLTQLGADMSVIEVSEPQTQDAQLAKQTALDNQVKHVSFECILDNEAMPSSESVAKSAPFAETTLFIDALFGIGLNREPSGHYADAIDRLNKFAKRHTITRLAVDIPSGLTADTGEVFQGIAVQADVTLCLVARKIGLHIKDGVDYSGRVVDIPLIPSVLDYQPTAKLQQQAYTFNNRQGNSYKGSFGHVLIIGGNQIEGSQGMGGAALLSATSAFATGVGKVTVACHPTFHPSIIAQSPNSMTIDLHDVEGVKSLIEQCDVVAIGMGLGRDATSESLFRSYLDATILVGKDMVIDADGLYHLAELTQKDSQLLHRLYSYCDRTDKENQQQIWYTPHSGEAARLIGKTVSEVESERLDSIVCLKHRFNGSWLLKGAGSLVYDAHGLYVCAAGNAGMATAGMGDVLSGVAAGLLAQKTTMEAANNFGEEDKGATLLQAVMIHAMAGDKLADEVGQWAVQASDMPPRVGQVLKELTQT